MQHLGMEHFFLILETSTKVCSVAIFNGSNLISLCETYAENQHASTLAPLIQQCLENTGIKIAQLSAIGISSGPGSYTGLRVGLATAKGIAFGSKLPLISLDTLQGMAQTVLKLEPLSGYTICPMLDARRMEVYCAFYSSEGQLLSDVSPIILNQEIFQEWKIKGSLLFLGPGADKCSDLILSVEGNKWMKNILPSAGNFGNIISEKFEKKIFENLITFEPAYLKGIVATSPKKMF